MKKDLLCHLLYHVALWGALTQLSACVSVKFNANSTKTSDRYSYTAPGSDFKTIKDRSVDAAWMHKGTGSTLSVRTKCQKGLDIDLESWTLELAEGLRSNTDNIKISKVPFSHRTALQTILDSNVEGFENKLAITTFVKNSCHYIIAFTALQSNFEKDLPTYHEFLRGFRAW